MLSAVSAAILLGCGDGGTAPSPLDLSGLYYGTTVVGPAICDAEVPGSGDPSGFSFPLLMEVTQVDRQVSAADPGDTLHYVGTFDGAAGGFAAHFRVEPTFADYVTVVDTLTARIEGEPPVLTAAGQRLDTLHRETAGQPEVHCTRSLAWTLTRRSQAVPELEPVACSREADLRPVGLLSSTLMLFRNESGKARDIYKLDMEGRRVPLDHLEPGERITLGALHNAVEPLVVTSTDGTCQAIYLPAEGPSYVTLR